LICESAVFARPSRDTPSDAFLSCGLPTRYSAISPPQALHSKVPIGLVASDWGGQTVETFSSPDALKDTTCGGTVSPADGFASAYGAGDEQRLQPVEQLSVAAMAGTGAGPVPNPSASQLWNAMIYPFLNMRFAGATWYQVIRRPASCRTPCAMIDPFLKELTCASWARQGEANAGNPPSYACRFPAMVMIRGYVWYSCVRQLLPSARAPPPPPLSTLRVSLAPCHNSAGFITMPSAHRLCHHHYPHHNFTTCHLGRRSQTGA
jgi:hypothetical protein